MRRKTNDFDLQIFTNIKYLICVESKGGILLNHQFCEEKNKPVKCNDRIKNDEEKKGFY